MFSRVRLNEEKAPTNTIIKKKKKKIARLLYFRFEQPQPIPNWPKVIANSLKLPGLVA